MIGDDGDSADGDDWYLSIVWCTICGSRWWQWRMVMLWLFYDDEDGDGGCDGEVGGGGDDDGCWRLRANGDVVDYYVYVLCT